MKQKNHINKADNLDHLLVNIPETMNAQMNRASMRRLLGENK